MVHMLRTCTEPCGMEAADSSGGCTATSQSGWYLRQRTCFHDIVTKFYRVATRQEVGKHAGTQPTMPLTQGLVQRLSLLSDNCSCLHLMSTHSRCCRWCSCALM